MFSQLSVNEIGKFVNPNYKQYNDMHSKLIKCIDDYDDNQLSLEEALSMFVDVDGNDLFYYGLLKPLQALMAIIAFYIDNRNMPNSIFELNAFLKDNNVHETCKGEDLREILNKFSSEENKIDGNWYYKHPLDDIDFEAVKKKINSCHDNKDNNDCPSGIPPVVSDWVGSLDI